MTTPEIAYSEIGRLVKSFKEIARVDEEIDRRVYALYGLTQEEIKVVEGKAD